MSSPVVLDASALLAYILGEPGKQNVAGRLSASIISAVNLSEVAAKLDERGFDPAAVRNLLSGLGMEVVPFESEDAYLAGAFRAATRPLGLSFGDRACIALARKRSLPIATSDTAFQSPQLRLSVVLIR